jgi:hypothetical protein
MGEGVIYIKAQLSTLLNISFVKKRERRNHTALAAAKDFLVSLHEFLLPSPNPQREEREFSRRFLVAPLGRCRDRSSQVLERKQVDEVGQREQGGGVAGSGGAPRFLEGC